MRSIARSAGLLPWPAATTTLFSDAPMKLYRAEETGEKSAKPAGSIVSAGQKGHRRRSAAAGASSASPRCRPPAESA